LKNPDSTKKELIVAYKGSAGEFSDKDWSDNLVAFNSIKSDITQKTGLVYHPQDADATAFTQIVINKYKDYKLILTGHSLGGHLAQRTKIDLMLEGFKVVTFNSFGIVTDTRISDYAKYIQGNMNFVVDGEFVDQVNKQNFISNLGFSREPS
jgi:Lipase (class 3)